MTNTLSASRVFNHFLVAHSLFALSRLNLIGPLSSGVSLAGLTAAHHLDEPRLRQIFELLVRMEVLAVNNGRYQFTEAGRELVRHEGFFTWVIGGYNPLLEQAADLVLQPGTPWRPLVRGQYVAVGSDQVHQRIMAPFINRALDQLPARCVADLGCGNAGRLIELISRRPHVRGIGIDIDPQAIASARDNIGRHKLSGNITLITENVFTTLEQTNPMLAEADLVVSFMMLHDLFNMRELDDTLFLKLRAAFPRARHYAFADTCRDESVGRGGHVPVFAQGFELIHALRGIGTFPLSHYMARFAAGGLKLVATHPLGVPNTYLFILEAPS